MIPPLFAPERRLAVLGLIALTAAEAAALAAAAALGSATAAALVAQTPAASALYGLIASALVVAALHWGRAVAAEDFGMRYSAELRAGLARHAVATSATARGGGLGTISARMTGDLTAVKDWVSLGLSDCAAAVAALIAGVAALTWAAGALGVAVAGLLCVVNGGALALAQGGLRLAWARVRRERGRVAALAGDIALSGQGIAFYDASAREVSRLDRRSAALRRASVRQRGLAALALAPATLSTALALAGSEALAAFGLRTPTTIGGWTLFLFGTGLIAAALASLARGGDLYAAYRVAHRRLRALDAESRVKPQGGRPVAAPAEALLAFADGNAVRTAAKGACVFLEREDPAEAALAVREAMASAVWRGKPVLSHDRRMIARAFPLVAPDISLLRASVGRNLGLRRRDVTEADMATALALAGLGGPEWTPQRKLDPASPALDAWTQAKLRLARAICHRPKAMFVAEPVFIHDPGARAMLERVSAATGATIIAAG